MKKGIDNFRFIAVAAFLFAIFVGRAEAAEKIRVGIAPFANKADWISREQVSIITDLFTFELAQSKGISVSEREQIQKIGEEQKFGISGLVDPSTAASVGRIMGLQYMLLGSVTQVDRKKSGGAGVGGVKVFGVGIGGGSEELKATIDMRVVDVSTAEIVLALRAQGSSKNDSAGIAFAGWGHGALGGFGYAQKEFGDLEASAIADAVTQLAYDTKGALADEYPRVIAADGNSFTVDVGASKEGALYMVYVDGKTLRGMNGEVIAHEKNPIAILKVTDVNVGYSVAKLADGGGKAKNIQRGDKVAPISAQKAKELSKQLPKDRPAASRASSGDDLLGGDAALEPAKPDPAPVKVIEGVDPDTTTDAKLIETYPLKSSEKNLIGIKHRNAYKLYSKKKYEEALPIFGELAEGYECDYLSSYWAGMSALMLKDNAQAARWFDLALARRPTYEPALKERAKL
jgi:curli biogenesis system outer membrane secretion channel CsgG